MLMLPRVVAAKDPPMARATLRDPSARPPYDGTLDRPVGM
jgi:hypothetical protein